MKTLVLREPGALAFEQRTYSERLEVGEALVKVRRVGICGTDLHAVKGDQPFFSYPRVLGHELGVEILDLNGDVDDLEIGDFCAVEPYIHCGECRPCRAGKTNCCVRLSVLGVHEDGGMRGRMVVPRQKLHTSSAAPLEHLAIVEMLSIGAHAVRRAGVKPDDRVAVVGAGPIGLSVMQFVRLAGGNPVAVEMHAGRRAFCRQFLDVEHCLDAAESAVEALKACFDGDLPDVVFDATGNAASMQKSFEYVGSAGRLVFVGLVLGDISFYDPEFHRKELTLMSSRNATGSDFRYVIRMIDEGRINLTPWITHRTPFEATIEAFPRWLDPAEGVVKAMIDMD